MVKEEILGRAGTFGHLYKATRITPVKSAKASLRRTPTSSANTSRTMRAGACATRSMRLRPVKEGSSRWTATKLRRFEAKPAPCPRCRRSARISDVSSTGTTPSEAGTVPAMAAGSAPTVKYWKGRPSRRSNGLRCQPVRHSAASVRRWRSASSTAVGAGGAGVR
jgi:hypothetical protein